MNIGILNVTSYVGAELARILCGHTEARIVSVTGRSTAGKKLGDVFPTLNGINLPIDPELSGNLDLVFSALPHKASAEIVGPLIANGVRVVDISADFRLKDPLEYTKWYSVDHPFPNLLPEAVYGLTELHRSAIHQAQLVANPGCYAVCAILALAPAIQAGIITPDIIIDGKSGVSGSGRALDLGTHFSEVNESVRAYALEGHRHLPEIIQDLAELTSDTPHITFVPHLIPMTRGILNACYANLQPGVIPEGPKGIKVLRDLYQEFYQDEPFVQVVDEAPATKHTLGSNLCVVHPTIDFRTNRLIVIGCLDNLVKGAAGQAVQNMNVMLELPEGQGLQALPIYP